MIQRFLMTAALVAAVLATACTSPPSGKQAQPKGPQFDADYYAQNAKEYYGQGRYGQAKDQWEKQLTKDPDNWMARLGIAYSEFYLAQQAVVSHGDYAQARTHIEAAEKGFRNVWSGQVEADTSKADPKRPQWRAALGLAMSTRALGYLDQIESDKSLEAARRGGAEGNKAANRAAELQLNRDRRYQEAIGLFAQLAHMEHASPEAIKNLGELYIVTKQDALAEQEFKRYLTMASKTHAAFEEKKGEVEKMFEPDKQDIAKQLYDEKLASNAEKQVSVMVDLGSLAWSRGDYEETRKYMQEAIRIKPDRKDLYLKLGEAESKLDMLETALRNVDEYLKRSSATRAEFDDDIRRAMKLRQEIDQKLKARGGK